MNPIEVRYRVGDAMTMSVVSVNKETPLNECAKKMREARIGSLIVTDSQERLLGILTERDMVRKGMIDNAKPSNISAEDIMVTHLITVSPGEDVQQALRLMRDHDIRHLPVLSEDRLVGFVTVKDLLSIQPDLFELWMEHYTIKEAERKPLFHKDA